jgi:hypothetical protein
MAKLAAVRRLLKNFTSPVLLTATTLFTASGPNRPITDLAVNRRCNAAFGMFLWSVARLDFLKRCVGATRSVAHGKYTDISISFADTETSAAAHRP